MAVYRIIQVRVTPRASKNELRCEGGALNVRVTAAPADGAANAACCQVIADALHVARSRVTVVRGQKSRVKTVQVEAFEGPWPWPDSSSS